MLTLQQLLNAICNNIISNMNLYYSYSIIGRSTQGIETNLMLLYHLYWGFPYISSTNQALDIERAQNIINITTVQ